MTMIDLLADNPLVQLLLLALATVLLIWVSRRREERRRHASRRARGARGSDTGAETPLPAPTWLELINERPDEIAHLAIFGPSGSGKTTLCQGVLAARGGMVVVIDPKPARPGQSKWGGMPFVRIDKDGTYRTIDGALRALRREVNARLAALDRGIESPLLTVILDEYKALVRECPDSAPDLLLRVSDIGRELGMRLIILSQSRGVVALGVKGQGDTRENFVSIMIDRQHRATLEWDEEEYVLDTAPVIARASAPIPPANWWPLPQLARDRSGGAVIPADFSRADWTGLASPRQSDAETGDPEEETDDDIDTGAMGATALDAEIIRALHAAGWSKNRICTKLRGAKDKKLRVIDAALADAIPGAR